MTLTRSTQATTRAGSWSLSLLALAACDGGKPVTPPEATPIESVASASAIAAPVPPDAGAIPLVPPEPARSAFGAFDYRDQKNGDCEVWWKSASGGATKLIAAPVCRSDVLLARLQEVTAIGAPSVKLPLVSKSGVEFRLWAVASARGGNATPACDYYAIVIDSKRAWGSPLFSGRNCVYAGEPGPFASIAVVEGAAAPSLRFVELPTGLEEGTAYEVTMGAMKTTRLPTLPMIAEETVTKTGILRNSGIGWRRGDYWMGDPASLTEFNEGSCKLHGDTGELYDREIRVKLRVRTWIDHTTSASCLSVQVVAGR